AYAGYRRLHDDVKTIHRDISVGYLMFKQIGGTVYGVLNDFDLAVQLNNEPRSTSKQRTGIKPYMVIDLLVRQPPYHLYRHDLESFLYVLVMENLSNLKHVVITKSGFPRPRDSFQQFELWIIDLRRLFSVGFLNSDKHLSAVRVAQLKRTALLTFDVKTLGGAVDFDRFKAVLETPIVLS
ncbi:hypothetical protein B0H14DRAFT_2382959, partial [Mycena olivaceomarginata]